VDQTKVLYVQLLCDVVCRKLLKLANVSRGYSKNNTGTVFLRHGVVTLVLCCTVSEILQVFMLLTPTPIPP